MTNATEFSGQVTKHMMLFIPGRRKELGISLDGLADRIGCSKTHVWGIEKGRSKNPSLWMILGLCEGLQCSLNSLLGFDISQPIFSDDEMALVEAHRRIFGVGKSTE